MSVKERVVIPKQKFDLLSKDNIKDTKSVGCQTEPNMDEKTSEETGNSTAAVVSQRIQDGIPGEQ